MKHKGQALNQTDKFCCPALSAKLCFHFVLLARLCFRAYGAGVKGLLKTRGLPQGRGKTMLPKMAKVSFKGH